MDLDIAGLTTEAELESLFVIPLLEHLGIGRTDLQMQRTLRFQAGRHSLVESVSDALREKRIRFDILVRQSDRNLFVIEAKRRGTELTEDDALQAISYALLAHPAPAPYALVTNGDETRLYDPVTRQRIWPDQVKLEGGFDITLPNSEDFDALVCFLRLSKRNLLLFARAQVSENMRALRGSPSDLAKKYIPDVHQPRAVVRAALEKFLSSSRTVLALVADSGMGKTCSMCHEALASLASDRPVLFFRGSELELRILEGIAEEFRWTFPETTSPQALIGRLSKVIGDEQLLIFLDAVDEWSAPAGVQQLGSLAKHLSDTRIKLVISSKTATWSNFLRYRGDPTDLAGYVEYHGKDPGLVIGALDEGEFWEAWEKYKAVYQFRGVWDPNLREEARRSPFFMRIAFEVAREEGLSEIRDSRREIFEHYYAASVRKTANVELADRVLTCLADGLLSANSDQLAIEHIRASLELRPTEELPRELVEYGILEKVGDASRDSARIRFAFEGLRNYIIAFKARRWHELEREQLEEEYQRLAGDGVQEEAWDAFYKLATDKQKRVIDHGLYEPAGRFLYAYKEIIETHFKAFGKAFPPGDPDRVGLVFEASLRRKEPFSYGVRLLREGEPEVLILPVASGSLSWNNLSRFGAGGLTNQIAPGPNWLEQNPREELLRVNFSRLLPKAVRGGALDEGQTPGLARELLAAAVLSKPELLNEPNKGAGTERLPLSARRIEDWLLLNQHWRRLEEQLLDGKVRRGLIPVRRRGARVSYSVPPLSESERAELRRRCDRLISSGVRTFGPGRYVPIDDIAEQLRRAIDALPTREEQITGPLFPEAVDWRRGAAPLPDSDRAVPEYVRRFVRAFLQNYEGLVRANFPTLATHFKLYKELPVVVRVTILEAEGMPLQDLTLALDFFSSDAPGTPTIIVESIGFSERPDWDRRRKELIEMEGTSLPWCHGFWTGADFLWGNRNHYPDLKLRSEYTVLRDFTYSWIERELPDVVEALGELYGVRSLRLNRW